MSKIGDIIRTKVKEDYDSLVQIKKETDRLTIENIEKERDKNEVPSYNPFSDNPLANYNLSSSLKLSYITSMNPHLLINTSSDLIERANMTISPSDIKTSSNSYFIKQISNHEDIKKYNEIDNDLDFFNSKFKVIFD